MPSHGDARARRPRGAKTALREHEASIPRPVVRRSIRKSVLPRNAIRSHSKAWLRRPAVPSVHSYSMPLPRALHPLLFEPRYWRSRLSQGSSVRLNLLLVPRPDLSSAGCVVQELRLRTHDGLRIWGLLGRCPLLQARQPARIRRVSACEHAQVDTPCVEQGTVDLVIQGLPARRLEDRVMDVLRVLQAASQLDGVDTERIRLEMPSRDDAPDEFLIVEELRAEGLFR